MNKTVEPKTLSGGLRVLPSKSASHRAVMMAAMAEGKTQLEPLQLSKDISATLACAQALGLTRGAAIAESETEGFVRAEIWGGGEGAKRALRELDCGESGSTLRFFIPLALDGRGPVRFVGHGRLMQRPLTVYEKLFAPLGVSWNQEGDALTVEGALQSGRFELPGDVSSQFITGLLLALPRLAGDSEIVVTTPLESRAYVELTRKVQRDFGVVSEWRANGQTLFVPGGQRIASPGNLHIEGDWSHAAFYLAAGAIGRGEIRLTGLDRSHLACRIHRDNRRIRRFPHKLGVIGGIRRMDDGGQRLFFTGLKGHFTVHLNRFDRNRINYRYGRRGRIFYRTERLALNGNHSGSRRIAGGQHTVFIYLYGTCFYFRKLF